MGGECSEAIFVEEGEGVLQGGDVANTFGECGGVPAGKQALAFYPWGDTLSLFQKADVCLYFSLDCTHKVGYTVHQWFAEVLQPSYTELFSSILFEREERGASRLSL
jgi:hypothetical protein